MAEPRDMSNEELLKHFEASELTQGAYARKYGMTKGTLAGRLYRARKSRQRVAQRVKSGPQSQEQVDNELILTTRWVASLDDLYEIFKVDLTKWNCYNHIVNYWGSPNDPRTQVKAWMELIESEAIRPVINPIEVTPKLFRVPRTQAGGRLLAMVVPDAHISFRRDLDTGELVPTHDRRALSVALEMARDTEPDVIVLAGDWMDMTEWTDKYVREPEFVLTTQPAIIECTWWMAQFRLACPQARIIYLKGNHENRLTKIMTTHVMYAHKLRPAAKIANSPLFSMDTLLGMANLDIEYIDDYPDGKFWLNDRLCIKHGDVTRSKEGDTARIEVSKSVYSQGFGHIHRLELATRRITSPEGTRYIYAFSPGCLCHVDGRVPGAKEDYNWHQGVAFVWYDEDGTHDCPMLIAIEEGVAWMGDIKYQGIDPVEQIATDMDYKL